MCSVILSNIEESSGFATTEHGMTGAGGRHIKKVATAKSQLFFNILIFVNACTPLGLALYANYTTASSSPSATIVTAALPSMRNLSSSHNVWASASIASAQVSVSAARVALVLAPLFKNKSAE